MARGNHTARQPAADNALPSRPGGVQLRTQRNPRLIALGVLLACLGGLGAAYLYTTATTSVTVVLVSTDVARGEVVEASDLSAVTIGSVPGVSTVPAGSLADQVGKTALVDLPSGSLLPSDALGTPVVPPGTAKLGLKLAAGRIPNEPIKPDTALQLVEVTTLEGAQNRVFGATAVSSPTVLPDGQTFLLDVRVSAGDAPLLAALAAQDNLVVIELAAS